MQAAPVTKPILRRHDSEPRLSRKVRPHFAAHPEIVRECPDERKGLPRSQSANTMLVESEPPRAVQAPPPQPRQIPTSPVMGLAVGVGTLPRDRRSLDFKQLLQSKQGMYAALVQREPPRRRPPRQPQSAGDMGFVVPPSPGPLRASDKASSSGSVGSVGSVGSASTGSELSPLVGVGVRGRQGFKTSKRDLDLHNFVSPRPDELPTGESDAGGRAHCPEKPVGGAELSLRVPGERWSDEEGNGKREDNNDGSKKKGQADNEVHESIRLTRRLNSALNEMRHPEFSLPTSASSPALMRRRAQSEGCSPAAPERGTDLDVGVGMDSDCSAPGCWSDSPTPELMSRRSMSRLEELRANRKRALGEYTRRSERIQADLLALTRGMRVVPSKSY